MQRINKRKNIENLFFNYPTKQWKFKELKENVQIADNKLSRWLKILAQDNIIKRIKPQHKMPYYVANYNFPNYQNKKKLNAIQELYESGFLNHLTSLKNIKTIIIFGSFTRWDWYKDSDIDVFIYGDDKNLEKSKYEKILDRNIELFSCKTRKGFEKISNSLMKNIIKGNIIKGNLDFLEVKLNG